MPVGHYLKQAYILKDSALILDTDTLGPCENCAGGRLRLPRHEVFRIAGEN